MQLNIGFAKVAEKGILFKGMYYSSLEVIRNRWFEKAWLGAPWKILILYNPRVMEEIYCYDRHEKKLFCCKVITPQSISGIKLVRYFESIQRLKANRKKTNRKAVMKVKRDIRKRI